MGVRAQSDLRNRSRLQAGGRRAGSNRREPDLTSLINIVFLILIFFIVAGTLRPFSARDIELAKVAKEAVGAATPSSLIIHQDGRVSYGGRDVLVDELEAYVRQGKRPDRGRPFTIVADGRAPGEVVLNVSRSLRAAGIEAVAVMVERGRR